MSILADQTTIFVKKIYALLVLLIAYSCQSNLQEDQKKPVAKEKSSVVVRHSLTTNIESEYVKEVEEWKEYKVLEEFMKKFYKTSPNEALSNALELKNVVISLRDSIKPTVFESPSFNARVNILYNEAERLADITFIPVIKKEEVNAQVEKIVQAFSAFNAKINTVLSQKRFEDDITISSDYIGLDPSKMDSISQKTISDSNKKPPAKKFIPNKKNLPKFKKNKNWKKNQKREIVN